MEMSDDVYANAEIIQNMKSTTLDQSPQNSSGEQQSGGRNYRLTAVCLGLLTVLLLIIITAISIHYDGVLNDTMEKYSTLSETLNQLQTNYSSLTAERDQLQTNYNSITAERDQLLTKYNSLTADRDQLQTNYNSITAERDQLLTKYNSLTADRDQLQTNYNSLTAQKDQLLTNYNSLAAETDQLKRRLEYSCPHSWIKFSSSCYYISKEKKTWSESRQYCRQRGADLVIINNREEKAFFTNCKSVWIGLTDLEREGTWKWVDGTAPITGYWISGEPNNQGGNEDCAVMHSDGWNDLPCSDTANWVCEKPAP